MNKNFFKQLAIGLVLFLLGYFTFNGKLFAAETMLIPTTHASSLSDLGVVGCKITWTVHIPSAFWSISRY